MKNPFKKSSNNLTKCIEALKIGDKEYFGLSEAHPVILPPDIADCDSAIYGVLHFFSGAIGQPINILGDGHENKHNKSLFYVHISVQINGSEVEYKMYFDTSNCSKPNTTSSLGPALNLTGNEQSSDSSGAYSFGKLSNRNGYRPRVGTGTIGQY